MVVGFELGVVEELQVVVGLFVSRGRFAGVGSAVCCGFELDEDLLRQSHAVIDAYSRLAFEQSEIFFAARVRASAAAFLSMGWFVLAVDVASFGMRCFERIDAALESVAGGY